MASELAEEDDFRLELHIVALPDVFLQALNQQTGVPRLGSAEIDDEIGMVGRYLDLAVAAAFGPHLLDQPAGVVAAGIAENTAGIGQANIVLRLAAFVGGIEARLNMGTIGRGQLQGGFDHHFPVVFVITPAVAVTNVGLAAHPSFAAGGETGDGFEGIEGFGVAGAGIHHHGAADSSGNAPELLDAGQILGHRLFDQGSKPDASLSPHPAIGQKREVGKTMGDMHQQAAQTAIRKQDIGAAPEYGQGHTGLMGPGRNRQNFGFAGGRDIEIGSSADPPGRKRRQRLVRFDLLRQPDVG